MVHPRQSNNDALKNVNGSLAVLNDGRMMIVHQKYNASIIDDTDLYYELFAADDTVPQWPAAMRELEMRLLSQALEALTTTATSFSVGFTFNKNWTVPSWIPVLGGSSGAEVKGTLTGTRGCPDASVAGSLQAGLKLFGGQATGSGQFGGSANWKAQGTKDNCFYAFDKAALSGSVGITAKIPAATPILVSAPLIGEILKVEFGAILGGGLNGSMTWDSSASFPSWPNGGTLGVDIVGGVYGEASLFGGDVAKAEITGTSTYKVKLLPSLNLDVCLKITVDASIGSWSVGYSDEWCTGDLFGSSQIFVHQGELPEGITVTYTPTPGTGNVYGGNHLLADVSNDLFADGPAATAVAADGTLYAAWAKEVDPATGLDGSRIVVSQFDGSSWSAPVEIPDSLGYNSGVTIAFDAEGKPSSPGRAPTPAKSRPSPAACSSWKPSRPAMSCTRCSRMVPGALPKSTWSFRVTPLTWPWAKPTAGNCWPVGSTNPPTTAPRPWSPASGTEAPGPRPRRSAAEDWSSARWPSAPTAARPSCSGPRI
jgi:hypothetical protein